VKRQLVRLPSITKAWRVLKVRDWIGSRYTTNSLNVMSAEKSHKTEYLKNVPFLGNPGNCITYVVYLKYSVPSCIFTILYACTLFAHLSLSTPRSVSYIFTLSLLYLIAIKSAFSVYRASGPPRTECSLRLIWHQTLDPSTPFYSKQIHRTRDPGLQKRQPFLLIILKGSQSTIQFFHYKLLLFPVQLCDAIRVKILAKSNKFIFPTILVRDRKRVNVGR